MKSPLAEIIYFELLDFPFRTPLQKILRTGLVCMYVGCFKITRHNNFTTTTRNRQLQNKWATLFVQHIHFLPSRTCLRVLAIYILRSLSKDYYYYYYAAFPSCHFSHKSSNPKAHIHINKKNVKSITKVNRISDTN